MNSMKKSYTSSLSRSWSSAFTLIELLVVIAIIGILASVVLVAVNNAKKLAKDARVKNDLVQIRNLATNYSLNKNGSYLGLGWCASGFATSSANNCLNSEWVTKGGTTPVTPDDSDNSREKIAALAQDIEKQLGTPNGNGGNYTLFIGPQASNVGKKVSIISFLPSEQHTAGFLRSDPSICYDTEGVAGKSYPNGNVSGALTDPASSSLSLNDGYCH